VSFNCPFRRPSPVADAFVLPKDGSKDYRLVEGESLGVFNTLQRLNIPSRLLIFPSENHVSTSEGAVCDWLRPDG
jgi:hypothetical protein